MNNTEILKSVWDVYMNEWKKQTLEGKKHKFTVEQSEET